MEVYLSDLGRWCWGGWRALFILTVVLNDESCDHLQPLTVMFVWRAGYYGNPLNKYIRHYEGLSYDTDQLHIRHQRARRALSHQERELQLEFHAHGR